MFRSVLLLGALSASAAAADTKCTFQPDTDYSHGGDRVQAPAVSSQDCCNTAEAKGYAGGVFSGGICWLKTKEDVAHPQKHKGAMGCIVGGPDPGPAPPAPPPPPPPPPPCSSDTTEKACAASKEHCTWTKDGTCIKTPPAPPKPAPPPPPAPCTAPNCAALEQQYATMLNETCSTALKAVPAFQPADSDAFWEAYTAFNGNGSEVAVMTAAEKLLSMPTVAAFLSLPDSFGAGGLDTALVTCAVLHKATPSGLAAFASNSTANEALVTTLLKTSILMRDMLVAGGATSDRYGAKYGAAMGIYTAVLKASTVLDYDEVMASYAAAATATTVVGAQANPEDVATAAWDDRSQTTANVLKRMALGTAVFQAVPVSHRFAASDTDDPDGGNSVDPVARYMHYEAALLAGELDPAAEVLTAFEQSYVTQGQMSNENLGWLRETMENYQPTHMTESYEWRYARAVRTEVAYGDPVWPDGVPNFDAIPASGGVCGPRAWFGRFCKRAYGLPTWGAAQPGHAAMTTWTPTGWEVLLGAAWPFCTYGGRGGPDFQLETQAREWRADYQEFLRAEWVSFARDEPAVSVAWNPRGFSDYGTGGTWGALALYAKKISVHVTHNNTVVPRAIGDSVIPTIVGAYLNKIKTPTPTGTVTTLPDGTIKIPADAFTYKNKTSSLQVVPSVGAGNQVLHNGGDPDDPMASTWSYTVTAAQDGTYYLTTNFTTWHMQTDLIVFTDTNPTPVPIGLFWTVGYWSESQPVEVKLVKGKNTVTFMRSTSREITIKDFLLETTKPNIPLPPKNHTPTPAPPSPPSSQYIMLPAGTTCEKQGITALTEYECSLAVHDFGYKYTGSKVREFMVGCFVLSGGQYKGNGNFNTNSSAACCDPDAQNVCIRK